MDADVEGFSLVVVVVTSALAVVDILVDGGTVVLLSANQCNEILHSDSSTLNNLIYIGFTLLSLALLCH